MAAAVAETATTIVRTDGRCDPLNALEPDEKNYFEPVDGYKAICDSSTDRPCCSNKGWCGISDPHCKCDTCVDYRGESDMFMYF